MTINTAPPSTPVLLAEITNVPVIPKITTSKRRSEKYSQILSRYIKYLIEEKQK